MGNRDYYLDPDGCIRPERLDGAPWLTYLVQADWSYINTERLERMADQTGRETLDYVFRTLDILDEAGLPDAEDHLVRTALCWSEVAKGGSRAQRRVWEERGYPLEIHNLGSAEIFRDHFDCRGRDNRIICTLIETHGLLGQYVRGEVALSDSMELRDLLDAMDEEALRRILRVLNRCIIEAVSPKIWDRVRDRVYDAVDRILSGDIREMEPSDRIRALLPGLSGIRKDQADFFDREIFPRFQLWYFESALSDFSLDNIITILGRCIEHLGTKEDRRVRHLNFKPLADRLSYDYKERRQINIYKQRIIEKALRGPSIASADLSVRIDRGILFADFVFRPVCEKLTEFCVEAERSGMLTYEKSIVLLYDMFGFRRDEFDRLNNEAGYLRTMNEAETSTKSSILDFVIGGSAVDVGSGGGILLDQLEARFPELEVIGTDISANVIEALEKKKAAEGRRWKVLCHNFVEGPLAFKTDNILFSSILHEIFSYTETANGRFDPESVRTALRNAAASLRPGGRIIIRDGVRTDSSRIVRVKFRDRAGYEFFVNYRKDFKGLTDIPEDRKVTAEDPEDLSFCGDINFVREFLYTFTWGTESYAHEVQELFGYFTLQEMTDCLRDLGLSILSARAFLEPGYPAHLQDKVDLTDLDGMEITYPDSNMIVAAEKSSSNTRL